jgi:hypothetical protein
MLIVGVSQQWTFALLSAALLPSGWESNEARPHNDFHLAGPRRGGHRRRPRVPVRLRDLSA